MRKSILLSLIVLLSVTSASAALGDTSGEAAESCKHIKDWRSGASSGVYWIDPGNSGAFQIYCDMDHDGGGWTLLMTLDDDDNQFDYSSPYWENADTLNAEDRNPFESGFGNDVDGPRKYESFSRLNGNDLRIEFGSPERNIEYEGDFGGVTALDKFSAGQDLTRGTDDSSGSCSGNAYGVVTHNSYDSSYMALGKSIAGSGINIQSKASQRNSGARFGIMSEEDSDDGYSAPRYVVGRSGLSVDWHVNSETGSCGVTGTLTGENPDTSAALWIRENNKYDKPEFELSINGPNSGTPGYSQEYSTGITNTGSATGEVGLLELTKGGRTQNSVDVGSLTPGESRSLSDFISFGSEGDYQICGKAEEVSKEKCITVTATEADGSTVWRRLVNFRLDLTGPDSGLGWDQDSSWPGMDGGDNYAPNQQDFKQGSSVVFTNVYWQDTFDSGAVTEDDLLEVHEPPMCGDDEREYLLEEMGESINSKKNAGRYACADTNNYCVYRRPSGYKIFDRGEKVNADEDGEAFGRFKGDEAVCAQRPGISVSSDYKRFPTRTNDLTPQWYDQDYANQINNDGSGIIDVPDQDVCRTNTLFGRQGVRWISMSEVGNNPHAFTGGIDDSWNPRLEQMNHPYYIADPDGENWDGDENPLNADTSSVDSNAEGFVPVPTGVEDLYNGKVAAPTNMGYGFCGGDDASEYLIHQQSESRFISTDTSVRGLARSPDHCMLDNSRFNIDESDLDRENFDGSNLQDERMIYEEGESVSFDSGGTTRSAACFSGKWWTDFPVVFLEDEKTVGLGSTGLTTFRVINPQDSSREFNLDLSISNDDLDSKVTFEDTGTNEMTVEIPGESSRTYDLKVRGTGAEEITSDNNVELQAQTTRGDLEGYDNVDISIIESLGAGTDMGATRDVPGIQLAQAVVLALLGSIIFFFTN